MRVVQAVLLIVILVGLAGASAADSSVVVASRPAEAYATVSRYALWPYIFPEVKSVEVVYQQGAKAVIRVTSWNGARATLEFTNDDQQRTLRFKRRGDRAGAGSAIMFRASATATTTVVSARSFGDLASIAAYFRSLPGSDRQPES